MVAGSSPVIPTYEQKKRSYDIAQQYRNSFFAPSHNSYRRSSLPLENTTQTTHNSEFIINNDRKSSVPFDNTTRTIHNPEFIFLGGASDGGKRMNGRLA